jgi:hypothetical protein
MRGGKEQGGKAKLTATENKQSEISGLDQGAQRMTASLSLVTCHHRQLIDDALCREAKLCN